MPGPSCIVYRCMLKTVAVLVSDNFRLPYLPIYLETFFKTIRVFFALWFMVS